MIRMLVASATIVMTASAWAADPPEASLTANSEVELHGRISRVEPFRPGEGVPTLIVDVRGTATTVVLGSMRYLIEQNFNPRAGMDVQVKGYKLRDVVVASEVTLKPDGKSIRLRDENGRPLWRGQGSRVRGGGRAY
jgi:hypothetical protein